MALTSDRLAIVYATLRWGVMAPLNDVRGAVSGAGGLTVSEERRSRTTLTTDVAALGITDATCAGRRRRERMAYARSSASDGMRSGSRSGPSGSSAGLASRSNRYTIKLA